MRPCRQVLVVDGDADYGRALEVLLRRSGDRVRVVSSRGQALLAARRRRFDLAVVDLFLEGGGVELARELSRTVPRTLLSFGARLGLDELLQAALGFPVHRKAALLRVLRRLPAARRGRRVALGPPNGIRREGRRRTA